MKNPNIILLLMFLIGVHVGATWYPDFVRWFGIVPVQVGLSILMIGITISLLYFYISAYVRTQK